MAREGSELGVNSIYCGLRIMKANKSLITLGYLLHIIDPKDIIKRIYNNEFEIEDKWHKKTMITNCWEGVLKKVR